ncbi:Uncharacterised protein [Grimontia hollisae]|uniref:Uncharacterized protein n=1 Tax=Grimontia hollisae TaxID=673 RepID=A0A377HI75_GRIHO|nr:Uncharacterised protein [Grimontia hollisae]STO55764.1 Uncharacterised protein [Grimontia hollisae]STQ77914.1 Uncharacterised protein [Grimontia hollisae]
MARRQSVHSDKLLPITPPVWFFDDMLIYQYRFDAENANYNSR